MKLKTLSRIDKAMTLTLGLVFLPFKIVAVFFRYANDLFEDLSETLPNGIRKCIGNRLLRASDEAKQGKINDYSLRYNTAYWTYKMEREILEHKIGNIVKK